MIWWREHLQRDEQAVELYPNLRVSFVKYEELHRNTEREREKLFKFLDVSICLSTAERRPERIRPLSNALPTSRTLRLLSSRFRRL